MRNINIRPHRQAGAALALSLVAMAILTIIGIAAMNSTLLQMLLAGNMQFQSTTLVNAENTLLTAERVAQTLPLQTSYGTPGEYNIAQDGIKDPIAMSWNSGDSIADSDVKNRYLLEHGGAQTIAGNSSAWGQNATGVTVKVIRVTAHSEGSKGAVRMVQSIYVQ
jgi:Tfp pilus assembly protein PilX